MHNFNGYRVFAAINTVIIAGVIIIFLFMTGITTSGGPTPLSENVLTIVTLASLIGSVVASWTLLHQERYVWGKYFKWFLVVLPWMILIIIFSPDS